MAMITFRLALLALFLAIAFSLFSTTEAELKVASFNLRIFGKSKARKPSVMSNISSILSRYDLVAIQEVREKTRTGVSKLLGMMKDRYDENYEMLIGPRLGRSHSKEQYVFLYKKDKVNVLATNTYKDTKDVFEREPYSILVECETCGISKFFLTNIHTDPDDAVAEIDHLANVYYELSDEWNQKNALILGDFNADCSYAPKKYWNKMRLATDSTFQWLIPNATDTTVAKTDCAYDRFVVAGSTLQKSIDPNSVKVFRFDEAYNLTYKQTWKVSDHYPIELTIL